MVLDRTKSIKDWKKIRSANTDLPKERYQSKVLPAIVALAATIASIQYICIQLEGTYLVNVFTEGHIPLWAGG